jgi:hypothetical protein
VSACLKLPTACNSDQNNNKPRTADQICINCDVDENEMTSKSPSANLIFVVSDESFVVHNTWFKLKRSLR